MAFLAIHILL